MERLDKNLWYRVKRYPEQPSFRMGNDISRQFRNTGIDSHEASTQPFAPYLYGTGSDKNLSFQMPNKSLIPKFKKRVFKNLDPQARIIGSLDLTKEERQQTAVIRSLQGMTDLIKDFLSTPKTDFQGNPMLDPITNRPLMETRTLTQMLYVAQNVLLEAMEQNNITPTPKIKLIIKSFTTAQALNILANWRQIVEDFPNQTKDEKERDFNAVVIKERMEDLTSASQKVSDAVGKHLVEEKATKFGRDWDTPHTKTIFPHRGFTREDWKRNDESPDHLKEYLMARKGFDSSMVPKSSGGKTLPISKVDLGREFARGHLFDLERLKFITPRSAQYKVYATTPHS